MALEKKKVLDSSFKECSKSWKLNNENKRSENGLK